MSHKHPEPLPNPMPPKPDPPPRYDPICRLCGLPIDLGKEHHVMCGGWRHWSREDCELKRRLIEQGKQP